MAHEKDKLALIYELCQRTLLAKQPMLHDTHKLLSKIVSIVKDKEIKTEEIEPYDLKHIVISCDASIKKNPGGPASVGAVVQFPNVGKYANQHRELLQFSRITKATSNNQAEYDAVYFGLVSLFNLHNNPECVVEVRSDSKTVVDQLNYKIKCNNKVLQEKRQNILELVKQLPVLIYFVWRPRNSTPELELANHLAQDLLDVPRH